MSLEFTKAGRPGRARHTALDLDLGIHIPGALTQDPGSHQLIALATTLILEATGGTALQPGQVALVDDGLSSGVAHALDGSEAEAHLAFLIGAELWRLSLTSGPMQAMPMA